MHSCVELKLVSAQFAFAVTAAAQLLQQVPAHAAQQTGSWLQVGVDVPEASMMLILGAEKFGLAQLHQIRGRVGRGKRASCCHLMCSEETHRKRLDVLTRESSGFEIARADLVNR